MGCPADGVVWAEKISGDSVNIDYAADEFDLALGAPGLDAIRRKVDWIERQTVLPPELYRRFDNDMFWRHPDATIRQVPIIQLDG